MGAIVQEKILARWLDENKQTIQLKSCSARTYKIIINEKAHTVTLHRWDAQTSTLIISCDKKLYTLIKINPNNNTNNRETLSHWYSLREKQIITLSHHAPNAHIDKTNKTDNRKIPAIIRAPLAGKILSVFVKPGETITPSTLLCTFESMKMENEMYGPADAIIETISIKPGDMIEPDQVIIKLSPVSGVSDEKKTKHATPPISNR